MKKSYLITLIFILSIGVDYARAAEEKSMGIFVEPMITYERGKTKVNYPLPSNSSDGTMNGFGIGGRAGIHFLDIVFVGLDGRYSRPRFKDGNMNANATSYNWGPVLGVQMPIAGLRVWTNYIWGGQVDPGSSNGRDLKFKSANGFRLGGGLRLGIASLNLEYQDIKYSETVDESSGVIPPNPSYQDTDLKNRSYVLSVSFPVMLL